MQNDISRLVVYILTIDFIIKKLNKYCYYFS